MDYEIDYQNLSPEDWEFLLELQSLDEKTQTFLIIITKIESLHLTTLY